MYGRLKTFTLTTLIIATPLITQAKVGTKLLADGFKKPVWAESPKGVEKQLWVVEKAGQIHILDLDLSLIHI